MDHCKPLADFVQNEIDTTAFGDSQGNYIERNLAEVEKNNGDPTSSFHGRRGRIHMWGGVMDLFNAGRKIIYQT